MRSYGLSEAHIRLPIDAGVSILLQLQCHELAILSISPVFKNPNQFSYLPVTILGLAALHSSFLRTEYVEEE